MTLFSKGFQRKTALATERWTNTVLVNIVVCELNICSFAWHKMSVSSDLLGLVRKLEE